MARPKKEGLDYFPVDVDFDKNVNAIIMLHKNNGLGWIIRFWQTAYKSLTGIVDLSGLFGELFANNCGITTEEHTKILSTATIVSFCYEIEKDKYTSNGIQKRISSVSKERSDAIKRQNKEKEKESIKVKEKEERKEKKSIVKYSKVKKCPAYSANNSVITTEESKPIENIERKCTWRESFQVYKDEINENFDRIKMNTEWIKTQEKFNPGVDILLSIEKSINNFWYTEGGWKHKKKTKTSVIDWFSTFANAIPLNKVYNNSNRYGPKEYTKDRFQEQMNMRLE